jgi:hypothetical protein
MSEADSLTTQEKIWAMSLASCTLEYDQCDGFWKREVNGNDIKYTCLLCNLTGSWKEVNRHSREIYHENRVKQLQAYKTKKVAIWTAGYAQVLNYRPKYKMISSKRGKTEVEAAMGRCMFQEPSDTGLPDYADEAIYAIKCFFRRERLYCLHLAIWKYACYDLLTDPPKSIHEWAHWYKEAWKKNKQAAINSNSITIIMSRVVPFIYTKKAPSQYSNKRQRT